MKRTRKVAVAVGAAAITPLVIIKMACSKTKLIYQTSKVVIEAELSDELHAQDLAAWAASLQAAFPFTETDYTPQHDVKAATDYEKFWVSVLDCPLCPALAVVDDAELCAEHQNIYDSIHLTIN